MVVVPTRCLSFHAAYRCRHAGECCRAGWDVDVEPHIVEAVEAGRIAVPRVTPVPFTRSPDGSGIVPARTTSGDCGFHQDCRCSLQSSGGGAMLPSACRHFPRVYLRDSRGDLLTLSHFCPTAASLLLDEHPVRVVEASGPLALQEPIEGLDARSALPPLVRPGMLADLDGFAAWEEAVIAQAVESATADAALATIAAATDVVRRWSPSQGPMRAAVEAAFASRLDPGPSAGLSPAFALVAELTGPHPLMEVPADFVDRWRHAHASAEPATHRIIGRHLAASAFANWIAYRGQGLRSIVAWLRGCHDVFRVQAARRLPAGRSLDTATTLEAIRMTDYIMVHTVDSLAFGRQAVTFER
jgi:hypothetical protein